MERIRDRKAAAKSEGLRPDYGAPTKDNFCTALQPCTKPLLGLTVVTESVRLLSLIAVTSPPLHVVPDPAITASSKVIVIVLLQPGTIDEAR